MSWQSSAHLAGHGGERGLVDLDDLSIYWESHGHGSQPCVVALHGALSTITTSFGAILPGLAHHRRVVAFELPGHGHTPRRERGFTLKQLASDVATAIDRLALGAVDVVGYSNGALVGLQVALDHPDLVRRLAFVSAAAATTGWIDGVLVDIANLDPATTLDTPWHRAYLAVAPDPTNWTRLVDDTIAFDRAFTGWSTEQLFQLSGDVLLMAADRDIVRLGHLLELRDGLDQRAGADVALAIVPNATHETVLECADVVVPILTRFFDHPHSGRDAGIQKRRS
jgi:pimeloyl-ACP methyl ester carboxylesterase